MNRKTKVSYVVMGLLVIGASIFWVEDSFFSQKSTVMNTPLPLVSMAHATMENIPFSVSALGEIKSTQEIDLMAQQAGYLTAIKVQNGAMVQKGQLLFQINSRVQSASVDSAQAGLDQAQSHFDRIQALVKEGAASQDELDTEDKNLQQAKATLQQAQKAMSETQVSAPFSGQVTETDLSVGSYVNVGDKLIGMVNGQDQYVQYVLPAQYLKSAKLAQAVSFEDPLDKTQNIQAKVTYLSPEVDSQNETFLERAALKAHVNDLSPGMMVMVTQVLETDRKVLALPGLAIQGDPNGFYVFVIEPDQAGSGQANILIQRVQIGEKYGDFVEVTSGLSDSDWVVVEGQEKVHEGQRVQYQTAANS